MTFLNSPRLKLQIDSRRAERVSSPLLLAGGDVLFDVDSVLEDGKTKSWRLVVGIGGGVSTVMGCLCWAFEEMLLTLSDFIMTGVTVGGPLWSCKEFCVRSFACFCSCFCEVETVNEKRIHD